MMRRWMGLGLAIGLAGCAATDDAVATQNGPPPGAPGSAAALTAGDVGSLPPVGAIETGTVPMLGRDVPLPDGQWEVMTQNKHASSTLPPSAGLVLLRSAGGRMTGIFETNGNALGHPAMALPEAMWCRAAESLGRDPAMLAADAQSAHAGAGQDCAAVGFVMTASWHDPRNDLYFVTRKLEDRGVVLPPVVVIAAVAETDGQYWRQERLILNPDLHGIAPDPQPLPLKNAWASTVYEGDAKKVALVNTAMAWAEEQRGVVRESLGDGAVAPARGDIQ